MFIIKDQQDHYIFIGETQGKAKAALKSSLHTISPALSFLNLYKQDGERLVYKATVRLENNIF